MAPGLVLTYRMAGHIATPHNARLLADFAPSGTVVIPTMAEVEEQSPDTLRLLVPLVVVARLTFVGLAIWMGALLRGRRDHRTA